jgi:hypothetical protein
MGKPRYIWDPGKMEEQRQFIMAETGLADPGDVPWIEESGHWHKRLTGITGDLEVAITLENGRYIFNVGGVASKAGYATLSEAKAACDEVARFRLPGVFARGDCT